MPPAWHDPYGASRKGDPAATVAGGSELQQRQHLPGSRSWDAYPDYVAALRSETLQTPGQVALVHGDGHSFEIDKPLNGPADGVLANFIRVETFGGGNTHWVHATIDPADPTLFRFEPRIVSANTR